MMSDDFLSDLSAAVETASTPITQPTNVTSPEVAKDVLGLMSAHEKEPDEPVTSLAKDGEDSKEKKRPVLSVKGKVKETVADEGDDGDDGELDDPKKPALKDDPKDRTPLIDSFFTEDEKHNLVLDGRIIASAGRPRTIFEALKREGREYREKADNLALSNMQLAEKFKGLYTDFEKLKANPERESLEKQTGMAGAELNDAVSLIKEYKVNPVQAIKRMLTQAQMRGIDLKSIGVNGGLDPAMVRDAIEQIMAKQQEQRQAPVETAKSPETAESEARVFLTENPAAVEHVETLAKAKMRFPETPLNQLWLMLQMHLRKTANDEAEKATTQKPQRQMPPNKAVTRLVTKPNTDYANMSYAEIARSIQKDNN